MTNEEIKNTIKKNHNIDIDPIWLECGEPFEVTTVEDDPEWPECLKTIGEIAGLLNVASEVRL